MKKFLTEVKYGLYIMTHPFKGFWDIKHEGEGSVRAASFLLALYVLVSVLSGNMTGYLFNPHGIGKFQTTKQIITVLVIVFCYCAANWGLTCLFDGKGTFKDIYRATGYVLVPLILSQAIMIPLSNFFVLSESAFYTTINSFGIIWTAVLLLISIIQTHEYTLTKCLVMVIAIVFAMCVIAYVVLLFGNLTTQLFGFCRALFVEFSSRFL